jgi:peptidyl-tRNA hydrolase
MVSLCLAQGLASLVLVSVGFPRVAQAQQSSNALAFFQVPTLNRQASLQLSANASYAYTEGLRAAPGAHHRTGTQLGATGAFGSGVQVGLRTELRHDQHPGAEGGPDSGTWLESQAEAQWGLAVARAFSLGAHGGLLWRPRQVVSAPVAEIGAVANWGSPTDSSQYGMLLGFRSGDPGAAVDAARQYTSADRSAAGVSEFAALPLAIGGRHQFGPWGAIIELSGELLVGADAPTWNRSPARLSLGLRRSLSERLAISAGARLGLSGRPSLPETDRVIPIEPRVRADVGITYTLFVPKRTADLEERDNATPLEGSLSVEVQTEDGFPLSDATVEVRQGVHMVQVPHQSLAQYFKRDLFQIGFTPGAAQVRASALRLHSEERTVVLKAGETVAVTLALKPEKSRGQLVLRVRDEFGHAISAQVRIAELGLSLAGDGDATFTREVPPGTYTVVVSAPGHRVLLRKVSVAEGVVVVPIDLEPAPEEAPQQLEPSLDRPESGKRPPAANGEP